jgi:PAS domain S-box-containing protein
MIGRSIFDVIHPDYHHIVKERMRLNREGKETPLIEEEYIRLDGSTLDVEVLSAPVMFEFQGQSAALVLARDITERKRAQEALRRSEGRYRLLAENASDVIWTMDMNLNRTYLSPSVEALRGYTVEEVVNQKLEDIMTPSSLKIAQEALSEEVEIERLGQKDPYRTRTLVLELKCKDGTTVWTESKITAVRDSEGRLVEFIGVTRDVTERQRLEEHKIRFEKLQTRLTMAGTVCHELHQPMQVIYGYVGFLLSNLSEKDSNYQTLSIIKKEIERMHEITKKLKKVEEYRTKDYLGISEIFDIHQAPEKQIA